MADRDIPAAPPNLTPGFFPCRQCREIQGFLTFKAGHTSRSIENFDVEDLFERRFSFFFYSNDHSGIHVHVRHGDGEAVFVIEPEVALRESAGLNIRQLSNVEGLINEHREFVREKWFEHFGRSGLEGLT